MNYFKIIPILIFTSLCYSQSEENYYNIIDSISENRIESDIKKLVSFGSEKNIKVLGKQALGMFMVGTDTMKAGKYISEHDQKIANKIAYVISGGDLSKATFVNEQYLLDLEREAFLSLCSERKTLERIQHILKTGKPLRN